jgi:hypothetical protein
LRAVAAPPSRLATHVFVAPDTLVAAYVALNVFTPICAFSLLHAAVARSVGEGASSAASAAAGTARANSTTSIDLYMVLLPEFHEYNEGAANRLVGGGQRRA